MRKIKKYLQTFLDAQAYEEIIKAYCDIAQEEKVGESIGSLLVRNGNTTWEYDTYEEFLAELRGEYVGTHIRLNNSNHSFSLETMNARDWGPNVYAEVTIGADSRDVICRMSNAVDRACETCFVPEPDPAEKTIARPKIFIGHGGSPCWRDLKDHLQDHHKYEVIAYETGARAGHTIRDVICEMMEQASFAILVMTAEDEMADGSLHARQNVVHEIGLFQGRLGFTKAVVVKENDTAEFSNIQGVQQVRFCKGNIKETFGDVLAVLRREFGENG